MNKSLAHSIFNEKKKQKNNFRRINSASNETKILRSNIEVRFRVSFVKQENLFRRLKILHF